MKKVREGYKMSELGEIPEEWSIVKLSDLSQKIGDGLHGTPKYVENSDYYFINGNNLVCGKVELYEDTKMVSEEDYIKNNKDLNENSLLISLNGTIGNVAYYNNEKIMLGKSSGYINLKGNINKKYIYYVLKTNTVLEYFNKELTGTTIKNLSLSTLRNTPIPLPNIREQEKIALILSTVDEQIDNVDALIEKNKELKKGLMQTLLTKGIGHTKFKKTEIGEIPDEWEVINAGRVFDIITDYVANGSFASLAANVEYKESEDFAIVVRLTDYKNEYKGPFVYVDKKAYDFLSKSKLEGDDIIIANVGAYAGYVFRAPNINKPITLGPNAILVRSEQNREFIYYWLSSEFGQKAIKEIISTTAQPKFNKTDFKKILLPIPNLKEQYKISSILLKTDERIEEHEKEKKKLEQLKKGLMQQLLTGRIRVV